MQENLASNSDIFVLLSAKDIRNENCFIVFPKVILRNVSNYFDKVFDIKQNMDHELTPLSKEELEFFEAICYWYHMTFVDDQFEGIITFPYKKKMKTCNNVKKFLEHIKLKQRLTFLHSIEHILEKCEIQFEDAEWQSDKEKMSIKEFVKKYF